MADRLNNCEDLSTRQTDDVNTASTTTSSGALPPPLPGERARTEKEPRLDPAPVREATRVPESEVSPVTDAPGSEPVDDANRDPLTGAPGAHPIGTGVGAAAAGTAGAALGLFAGPVGGLVAGAIGAAVGAVAGGLAGKGIAEAVNPTAEDAFWREEHRNRPYYDETLDFDSDYATAYNYGYSAFDRYPGQRWEDVEPQLGAGWEEARGTSRLTWDRAKLAAHDAWLRLQAAMPGHRDRL
jgi:uncharacterized protein YcfJ